MGYRKIIDMYQVVEECPRLVAILWICAHQTWPLQWPFHRSVDQVSPHLSTLEVYWELLVWNTVQ